MLIKKLFLAATLAVAMSAQAVVTEHDDAKTIIKKADKNLGPQIDKALSQYKDHASGFEPLAANLEKSMKCIDSTPKGTSVAQVTECRMAIQEARIAFAANYVKAMNAEQKVMLCVTRLLTLAASLTGPESGATRQYAKHLEATTRNNFGERYYTLTIKTRKVLDELSQ